MKHININKIVFIIFIFLTLLIGSKHEPWADEAQSWIIARDASVFEIIWDISRYEGTFPLWILTLKFFITIGLRYEYLFIVPIIISSLGLIVFLKNKDIPIYVKILLPFTYYIFYQYTIIARSYCYLFLALSILLNTYKKRITCPLKYILTLIFISFISIHGMIIACTFWIIFLIEILKENNLKKYIKNILLFLLVLLIELIILFPRSDLYMVISTVFSFKEIVISILNMVIGDGNLFFKIYNIITVLLFIILFLNLIIIKNKDFFVAITLVFAFMFLIRIANHHLGIIYLLVVFGILNNYENIKNRNKYIDGILIIVMSLYLIFSVQASLNDHFNKYSGAEEMANYIKMKEYQDKEIYGIGYKNISLQPYFEENLYKNLDETIFRWSLNNENYYIYCNFEDYEKSDFTETPQYIVLEWNDESIRLNMIEKYIEETNKYEIEYRIMGYQFFKNYYSETEGYTLYRLKENID